MKFLEIYDFKGGTAHERYIVNLERSKKKYLKANLKSITSEEPL